MIEKATCPHCKKAQLSYRTFRHGDVHPHPSGSQYLVAHNCEGDHQEVATTVSGLDCDTKARLDWIRTMRDAGFDAQWIDTL